MEVDQPASDQPSAGTSRGGDGKRGPIATGVSSVTSVSLHPLVIMNISDHWTRMKCEEGKAVQVIGALIGKQKGRNIEVMNSFELRILHIENNIVIDRDYYDEKEKQFKQVFPDLDFLGWYATGDCTPASLFKDRDVHEQVSRINENPIFLKLSPMLPRAQSASGVLPIKVYESVIDVIDGEPVTLFVELAWNIATEEAERIGLDHMARMSSTSQTGDGTTSLAAENLRVQMSAVKMLRDRVKLILDYAKEMQAGTVPWNHEVLRDINSLCHRLPAISSDKFDQEFFNQCNDVSLMSYLGMINKGTNSMNHFVNKFNILYDRSSLGRRMRGLFF